MTVDDFIARGGIERFLSRTAERIRLAPDPEDIGIEGAEELEREAWDEKNDGEKWDGLS